MRPKQITTLLFMSAALISGLPSAFAESPLEALGALVEGDWRDEDSRHVFEWGVGQRTLRSRSYQRTEDDWSLVGEGMWFWDPGQETLRGIAVAIGMPVELFEYRSEVRGNEVVHDLVAQGPAGGEYVERWTFAGDSYRWTLDVENEGRLETIMGGAYQRADSSFVLPLSGNEESVP